MTCRKARQLLSQKGVQFQEREFFKGRFTEAELRDLTKGRPASDFFSWKSPSIKRLGLENKDLSQDEIIRYILQEPRLLRRPVIRVGDEVIIGWDEKRLDEVLKG